MKKIRWICLNRNVGKQPFFMDETINEYRAKSIAELIRGTSHDWNYWKKEGWRCVKVEITITEI